MGKRVAEFVATTGGLGYLPLAPGTWAAAFSAILWCVICFTSPNPFVWQLTLMPILIYGGVYCSEKILKENEKDPSHIVIDEFAGLWLTLLFVQPSYKNAIAGFILFRIFDIAKPFGIRKMEQFKKGWGIMLDDLLAGLYSNLILQSIVFFKIW
jgi:phosphatidylglycerophosphatase A